MRSVVGRLVLACLIVGGVTPAFAAHYASLRRDEVNLREGPTYKHPILWIYKRKGYPVEVVASYDTWRRVKDPDGTVGWVNAIMLSDERTVLVTGRVRAPIRDRADASASTIALAEPGVVARLKTCTPAQCEIAVDGTTGWIDKRHIWGVGAHEVFP